MIGSSPMRYLSILLLSGVSLLLSGVPSEAQLAAPNDAGLACMPAFWLR